MSRDFRDEYGPWAVIAGGSEGIGEAFANAVAERGLNVLLLARREGPLRDLAEKIEKRHGVEARWLAIDLGAEDLVLKIADATEELKVGLVVYNAAYAPIGSFLDAELPRQLDVIRVNCMGPLTLAHHFGQKMARRGQGGIVLMSSLAGFHGSAMISAYSATKAFNRVFAEGLWDELRSSGVHVLAACAGATDTPGYRAVTPVGAVKTMPSAQVAEEALAQLGKRPTMTPGLRNRLAGAFMQRLLPRRAAVRLLGRTMRSIYGK